MDYASIMAILMSIERETVEVFLKEKPRAHSCPDLPLGDTATAAPVDRDMLTCLWNEIDYRIDVLPYYQRWTH